MLALKIVALKITIFQTLLLGHARAVFTKIRGPVGLQKPVDLTVGYEVESFFLP